MSKRLEGKAAVVTGSTFGIGRGTANLLACEGARVVVNGRSAERGAMVAEEIRAAGGEAVFYQADVGRSAELKALVQFAVDTYGRLDILMNNAFSGKKGSVLELEEADWDAHLAVSLKAVYLGSKYAIPEMRKVGGGAIINVSSVQGLLGSPGNAAYQAAKAAVINLTRQMAVEFGPDGIRVNAICPGLILVENASEDLRTDTEKLRRKLAQFPLRRLGLPIDVARAAVFLASEESSFITGQTLVVDGGITAQLQGALANSLEQVYRESFAREAQERQGAD